MSLIIIKCFTLNSSKCSIIRIYCYSSNSTFSSLNTLVLSMLISNDLVFKEGRNDDRAYTSVESPWGKKHSDLLKSFFITLLSFPDYPNLSAYWGLYHKTFYGPNLFHTWISESVCHFHPTLGKARSLPSQWSPVRGSNWVDSGLDRKY